MTTVEEKIENFSRCAELMPGVVVIHELDLEFQEFKTVFMSSKGLDQLGVSLNELKEMGSKYHERFFNNEDMEGFMQKLQSLMQNKDPEETFTFFQQVKFKDREDWVWHVASIRIFHQDEAGNPTHLVTTAFPMDQMKHIPNKAERLLAENQFFKNNLQKFLCLGNRAKEVLRLVAMGKSSVEIAEELNISVETVNTHRKNIKKKLQINTTYEFTEYAHAFDLI
ncbi:MAG: helix-turn-helix transcriptional regulator [Salinimicrobium sp.]